MKLWPFMLKRTHARHVETFWELFRGLRDSYQGKVDAEYARARDEGQAQVHQWATEVNYNIFYGDHPWNGTQCMRATAALQEAEHQFSPTRTQLEAKES